MSEEKDKVATLESLVNVFRQAQEEGRAIDVTRLPEGTVFELITISDNLYTVEVTDPKNLLVKVLAIKGFFANPRTVRLVGATVGSSSSVLLGHVGRAFCIEFADQSSAEAIRTGFVKEIVLKRAGGRSLPRGASA